MTDDLSRTLARLLKSGDIESATVTVVLRPRPPSPPVPAQTVCIIDFGPVSCKE